MVAQIKVFRRSLEKFRSLLHYLHNHTQKNHTDLPNFTSKKMNRGGLKAEGKWNNNSMVRPYTPDEEIRASPAIDIVEFAGEDFRPEACNVYSI